MADPTQYLFSHKDVVSALIREQGLHEGKWMLLIQFSFAAANVGLDDASEMRPAAVAGVQAIGLQRATTDVSGLVVDAAEVNPASGASPRAEAVRPVQSKGKSGRKR